VNKLNKKDKLISEYDKGIDIIKDEIEYINHSIRMLPNLNFLKNTYEFNKILVELIPENCIPDHLESTQSLINKAIKNKIDTKTYTSFDITASSTSAAPLISTIYENNIIIDSKYYEDYNNLNDLSTKNSNISDNIEIINPSLKDKFTSINSQYHIINSSSNPIINVSDICLSMRTLLDKLFGEILYKAVPRDIPKKDRWTVIAKNLFDDENDKSLFLSQQNAFNSIKDFLSNFGKNRKECDIQLFNLEYKNYITLLSSLLGLTIDKFR
jgi:hypothetical protein